MKRFFKAAMMGLMMFTLVSICLAGDEFGILSGTVVDAEYGEAVEGALVFVRICQGGGGDLQGTKIYSDTTNEFGEFYIADVPAGEWTAIARLRGVGRAEQVVLIENGVETIVTFTLEGGCPGGLMMHLHQGGE